jgi:hypothetical protein
MSPASVSLHITSQHVKRLGQVSAPCS